ncbi:MAG: peptidoglycan DD-metalloendopeptidase family protein [Cyclobacteriaceae bacterium]|nr:peptidoglycan DD-metalloendopeptidase family protein [Cyclobacteriaceae bacterium]
MKLKYFFILLFPAFLSVLVFFYYQTDNIQEETSAPVDSLVIEITPEPQYLFGIQIDSLIIIEDIVKKNQSLSDILLPYQVDPQTIFTLAKSSKDVFDVRKMNAGKKYTLICNPDSINTPRKLVYEPSIAEYIIFHLDDSLYAESVKKEITVIEKVLEGVIDHSLSVSIEDIGGSVQLTNDMVDVLAWQIDFFRLQKGDTFKVLFEEKQIEGQAIGIGDILAIHFEHSGNPFYAFAFDQGEGISYFDEKGENVRRAFLKYPLEFSRISSRYTLNRFHPVQKRYKAHLGTDFAAPTGTPIRSVGQGIVLEARYSKNNGNFVKVRHNATYTTQYLHMSKIANGIRAGQKVGAGQLIGYVGSTGLATGAHLCYRFWKNGVQVDALSVKIPPAKPVEETQLEAFEKTKQALMDRLSPKTNVIASVAKVNSVTKVN